MIQSGLLAMDDDAEIQRIDSVWLDDHAGFYMKDGAGKAQLYDRMIGNVTFLNEWSKHLPRYPITCPQPWFYCARTSKGLPLLYKSSMEKISHRFRFRDKIEDLLRMRVFDKDEEKWIKIPFNEEYIYPVGKDKLDIRMKGRYAQITTEEREFHLSKTREVYYDDIISIDAKDEVEMGKTPKHEIQSNSPVRAIFWNAENCKARRVNCYSNYTTNRSDPRKGWNPITRTLIQHGAGTRNDMSSHESDGEEVWEIFPSAPRQAGYNVLSIGYTPSPFAADVGLVLNTLKTTMTFFLGDTRPKPYKRRNADYERNKSSASKPRIRELTKEGAKNKNSENVETFIMRIRLLVHRKLIISKDGIKVVSATDEELIKVPT